MPVSVTCRECGEAFLVAPAHAKKRAFCSTEHRVAYQERRSLRICEGCGIPFRAAPSRIEQGEARFHNRVCMGASRRRTTRERVESKLPPMPGGDACRVWLGFTNEHGYGRLVADDGHFLYAHRAVWELEVGPIPDGTDVLHTCDNPPCCRLGHLFLGDQRANNRDRDLKGRVRHGRRHANAKLTEDQVREARALYANGGITTRQLAARFSVGHATVEDFLRWRTWRRTR